MFCDGLEGWDRERGEGLEKEGRYTHTHTHTHIQLWLICIVVWQKPTQYYKAIFLQLKSKKFFKKKL